MCKASGIAVEVAYLVRVEYSGFAQRGNDLIYIIHKTDDVYSLH